ncbi:MULTISPECIES: acetolactate synthase 3 large subunit [Thalassospira]|uniref:Acetolactate synthase n=2 Tax=Thalassospira TaxID=168934 RepID=A0A367WAG2_9PROT|nr:MULTISPECIES: acetolactate synthase 3 large subunit [Thalassospira]MDG4719974.1 acetolactate synthase 3 large subunit [Thalassospira sp. FZY0004]RCK38413.1 acetolactate synthase [Thalassospira profundimaris]
MAERILSGSEVVLQALADQGVEVVFGYPGGAVLPLYDEIFKQNRIRHVLVRHEQAAVHAAEGYARSTGKVGVVLVTSGPGATNAVTGLTDALMDSIPVVCLTGQVPTHLIGNDAFQEADTTGITRPCTKHNYLVKNPDRLARTMHEAFHVASSGRPGPVVIDLPKDILVGKAPYMEPSQVQHRTYNPVVKGERSQIEEALEMLASAKKPILYCGGGVINSGTQACKLLTEFTRMIGAPITLTLMGLGAYPASDKQYLGMVGMHGTYESNMSMHDCDVMVAIGARFDDRVTGNLDFFAPNSQKIQIDIDQSSINKNVPVDIGIVGDVGHVLEDMIKIWKAKQYKIDATALDSWWDEIEGWRGKHCLSYKQPKDVIKPQHVIRRVHALTRDRKTYITTDVGQHQMWAAQHFGFEHPYEWMTSGGLGTMGYGMPAALGVQVAHPDATVVCFTGDASIMMNIQECATMTQYRLPIKTVILNNRYMGMVRQWQQLLHGSRYSESYSETLPDFVKLSEAFGFTGLTCNNPADLDDTIKQMLEIDGPVILDVAVDDKENCYPMIPSGKPHNEMLLGQETDGNEAIDSDEGMVLV